MEKFSWKAMLWSVVAIVVAVALYDAYLKTPIQSALPKI